MTAKGHYTASGPAITLTVTLMLIGLPLAGAVLSGHPVSPYLEFPPLTHYVIHAPFSWTAFGIFAAINLLMLTAVVSLLRRAFRMTRPAATRERHPFPVWGWFAMALMMGGWLLAWQRYPWFARFQGHTFCLPWLGYIALINALCQWRSGRCPLGESPGRFLLLFPTSAVFWWFFEYLNRFVQNWYYVGVDDFGPAAYTLFASLAFATVLPAVLSTYRLLLTFDLFGRGLVGWGLVGRGLVGRGLVGRGLDGQGLARQPALEYFRHPFVAGAVWVVSGLSLFFLGWFPDYLFALVWAAPLLIITALRTLAGRESILSLPASGDWRPIVTAAIAALICGFFWEMWNIGSQARWEYAIPFVDRYHLFAMPVLGYGGYLPFGLECLAICLWMMPEGFVFPWRSAPSTNHKLMTAASQAK